MKRIRIALTGLFISLILFAGTAVYGAGNDTIVFDDYANTTPAAQGGSGSGAEEDLYEAGMEDTVVDNDYSATAPQDYAYEENNDGDDTYVSNDGTTFRIPRVSDTTPRIYDYSDLFTEAEEAELTERIRKIEKDKNADILVLTSDDVPRDAYYSTETSMRYARQFLIDNHFKEDSFICIIDMNNRVFWAVGYGKYGTQKYSGWGTKVYEKVKSDLSDRAYAPAVRTYIRMIDRLDNPLLAAIPTALSVIVSAVLSFLTMLGFTVKHNSTQPSKANTPPVVVEQYRTIDHDEDYLGTTVTRRRIVRESSGGGGGGGGGFSGGGFSSGSGGSYSGGGGHF